MASGMAGKIRRCAESDEFDLGGYSRDKCNDLAKEAFSEPFELKAMPKLTFTVGGGKGCRQKYGDDLARDWMSALDAIGFDKDNGACCELSCGGKYKYQHDTSKNLIFVHVFPKVVAPAGDEEDEAGEDAPAARREPADVLAECEIADFRRMVTSNVTAYACKKRLLDGLKERIARLEEAEQKLITRQELDAELQKLYDTLSVDGLKEKVKVMAVELQSSIDAGELTAEERPQVLEQLDGKLSALQTALTKAEADGKAKAQAKLEEQRDQLREIKAAVSDSKAAGIKPLKYGDEVARLSRKLGAIARIEKESSGKYTLDELKRIGERPDIEEALSILQTRSRMWFESDEEFDVRLRHCKAQAAPKKKAAAAGGYSAGSSAGGGWSSVKSRR